MNYQVIRVIGVEALQAALNALAAGDTVVGVTVGNGDIFTAVIKLA